ncbi:hypothetical protein [Winogradskyella ursingii]|uniref:hypothetical protein n=1 Tax=Winogradskyella ursingii TaxID=2686079 RepID=UPI0015CB2AD7|nr:hypothetical protein [Winogradskyella ursingii]
MLSILAIIISLGQLIFTMPFVLKQFEKVELKATEIEFSKVKNLDVLNTSFIIMNTGENTADNVELQIRTFNEDKVIFNPDIFELIKGDNTSAPVKNLIYKCEAIVPNEKVRVYIKSSYTNYLDFYSIDTLEYEKPISLPEYQYGPTIIYLKHSLGKVNIRRKDSLLLKEVVY